MSAAAAHFAALEEVEQHPSYTMYVLKDKLSGEVFLREGLSVFFVDCSALKSQLETWVSDVLRRRRTTRGVLTRLTPLFINGLVKVRSSITSVQLGVSLQSFSLLFCLRILHSGTFYTLSSSPPLSLALLGWPLHCHQACGRKALPRSF